MPDPSGDHDDPIDVTTFNPTSGTQVTIRCARGSRTHETLVGLARRGELDIVAVEPAAGPAK